MFGAPRANNAERNPEQQRTAACEHLRCACDAVEQLIGTRSGPLLTGEDFFSGSQAYRKRGTDIRDMLFVQEYIDGVLFILDCLFYLFSRSSLDWRRFLLGLPGVPEKRNGYKGYA
ncbi:hypothetical protein NDU88_004617 [Pleurodeles waltl]|uniref:Uncharacterized protein n=1 Tax=Pleurodeles waltl TaxID=8319 RepID=A0AAV7UFV8_PLEWA|nr:hypothetical protein NDU88_004617 [Pleurodeles waltl]